MHNNRKEQLINRVINPNNEGNNFSDFCKVAVISCELFSVNVVSKISFSDSLRNVLFSALSVLCIFLFLTIFLPNTLLFSVFSL